MSSSRYTAEQWQRAEALVVAEGTTLAESAEATGIVLGTLKRRAAKEQWTSLRDKRLMYRPLVQRLKLEALQKAIDTPTPEQIGAWATIERTFPEKTYGDMGLKRAHYIEVMDKWTTFVLEQELEPEWQSHLQSLMARFFKQLAV